MEVATWTPKTEWETLRHTMDRWFEGVFPGMMRHEMETAETWPRLDVRETEAAYVVETGANRLIKSL
jgi:HSP20 family molecular chaperone IbpA